MHCNQPNAILASDVSMHGRLFATGIVHHWNTKVVFIEPKRIFAILRSLFSRPVLGVSQHSIFRTGRLGWSFIYSSEWLRPAGKPHEILSDDIVQPRLLVFLQKTHKHPERLLIRRAAPLMPLPPLLDIHWRAPAEPKIATALATPQTWF
jgi:hypothetical protein